MKNRTTLGDLLNAQLGENFRVGDTLREIVTEATRLGKWTDEKVGDDGNMAKVYAEHYSQDMRKLAKLAEKAVALLVANGKKENAQNG